LTDEPGNNEDRGERINRKLIELLNGLRVALPCVLFGWFWAAWPLERRLEKAPD
jgi:hypothetical protein